MKKKKNFFQFSQLILIAGISTPFAAFGEALTDQLNNLFGPNGLQLEVGNIPNFTHEAHFSSVSIATLGALTQQLAITSADIPAISTIPGLTYRYNPELQSFERSSGSLGSIYIERPLTVGRGHIEFGFSYNYVEFTQLNGRKLNRLSFLNLHHDDCCGATIPSPGDPTFEDATADIVFNKFSLQSHIFNFSTTYGITDNWDVNILIPIIQTSLDLSATAHINDVPFSINGLNFPNGVHFFPNGTKTTMASSSGSYFGVGDIQLRTKYHFLDYKYLDMAGGVNLRLPSGSEKNFQGVGYTTVLPYLAFSSEYGIIDLHATVGVEFNTGNDKRDRLRYAGGATFTITEQLALITDFIGASNIRTNDVSVQVPQFLGGNPTPTSYSTSTSTVQNDTLDLALGLKFIPMKSVVGYFNVFVPLNNQGLRADVIPTGGIQVGF